MKTTGMVEFSSVIIPGVRSLNPVMTPSTPVRMALSTASGVSSPGFCRNDIFQSCPAFMKLNTPERHSLPAVLPIVNATITCLLFMDGIIAHCDIYLLHETTFNKVEFQSGYVVSYELRRKLE